MKRHLFSSLRIFFVVSFLSCVTYAQEDQVNAIFNGDFVLGVEGWRQMEKAGNTDVDVDIRWVVENQEGTLDLKNTNLTEVVQLLAKTKLHVKEGEAFELTLNASGKGKVKFGSFFYNTDDTFKASQFSDECVLAANPRTYRLAIKIPKGASTLRPAINFVEEKPSRALAATLYGFQMLVPESRFDDISKEWPKQAKDPTFVNYRGFTEQERAEMKAVAEAAMNTVLPPYKPIKTVTSSQHQLTTSKITFDKNQLPASIVVLNEEILKGAMEFETTSNGKNSKLAQSVNANIKASDINVTMTQSLENADAKMDFSCTLSYDALLLYNLKITPKQDQPLEKLVLRIPLDNDIAKYIRYNVRMRTVSSGGSVFGYGPIPAAGEKVETRAKLGRQDFSNNWKPEVPGDDGGEIWSWKGDSFSSFWLGDEKRGLAYINTAVNDNDRVKENDKAFTLTRTGDTFFADLVLFNKPLAQGKTYEFTFVLQVMPPKRVNPKWASLRWYNVWNLYGPKDPKTSEYMGNRLFADNFDKYYEEALSPSVAPTVFSYATAGDMKANPSLIKQRTEYKGDGAKYMDAGFIWFDAWSVGCSSPMVKYPERLKKFVKISDMVKHLIVPYMAATHISPNDKNGAFYAGRTQEWAVKPFSGGAALIRTCPNSGFSEYLAWGIGKMIDEYDISGIYFDNCALIPCKNTKHGCGYIGADGEMHKEFAVLGTRKLFMMVRNEFVKRGKDPMIVTHAAIHAGTISFTDVQLEGEGSYGIDFIKMYSPGELRAQFIGENQYGVKRTYLPQICNTVLKQYKDPADSDSLAVRKATLSLLSLSLQYGFDINIAGRLNYPEIRKVWQAFDELGHQNTKFIPYWELKDLNKTLNSQDIYASIYTSKDGEKAILALSNHSAEAKTIHIPRGQLTTFINAKNAFDRHSGHKVDYNSNGLTISIKPKHFRLITFIDACKLADVNINLKDALTGKKPYLSQRN